MSKKIKNKRIIAGACGSRCREDDICDGDVRQDKMKEFSCDK